MRRLYRQWMYDWETRLADRDSNRVVRPFEWGLEWTKGWPLRNGECSGSEGGTESVVHDLNRRIVADSGRFFSYVTPSDFRLEENRLQFTSPVRTPYAENNLATAGWFPAGRPIRNGRSRQPGQKHAGRSSSCHSGMPRPRATSAYAASSTGWESLPCV